MEQESDIEAEEIVFHGVVQGVGFRYTSHELARQFPISGWVRNEPDGTVRLFVQGPREAIDAYLNELKHHSRLSRLIDQAISEPATVNLDLTRFTIEKF